MDPRIWPSKSRTTSSNIHTAAMWGYWRKGGCNPLSICQLCSGYIHRSSILLNFFVFHTSGDISFRLAAFLFLIFVSTMSSFSSSLMSSWLLLIFVIVSSVTLREFSSRFLKCSFHMCIHSSWLTAFSLTLEVLFLLLTSFTVCHTVWDCLFSNKFLILLVWSWMYSVCSFWYALRSHKVN